MTDSRDDRKWLDDRTVLESVQRRPDGTPRFVIPLPGNFADDPGLRMLARHESEQGGWEYPARAFLDAHLRPGDVFIDVGAHFGVFALTAATVECGGVSVLAIEPHPFNVANLLAVLAENKTGDEIEVVAAAAGAAAGTARLWHRSSMGHSLGGERPDDIEGSMAPVSIPVVSLDGLLAERPELHKRRVYIKIDAEGMEPQIIAGAKGLLQTGHVSAILLERGPVHGTPEGAAQLTAALDSLTGVGYLLRWFPHAHLPGPLIPWVPGNEVGNIVALAPGLKRQPVYDGPFVAYPPQPPGLSEDFDAAAKADLTRRLIDAKGTDGWRWSHTANLEHGAEERAKLAAPHLPKQGRILDLGAGLMAPIGHLDPGVAYTPLDLLRFAETTVVCDLNDGQFPDGAWDCALALELLEYIHDLAALLVRTRKAAAHLILTYRCSAGGGGEARRAAGYFNDLDLEALKKLLAETGWTPTMAEEHDPYSLIVCD
jgi:FkbM family methyltransferase